MTHPSASGSWIVQIPSPFPRERRDRLYGPFATKVEADEFAASQPATWRAEVRPVSDPEFVRSP